MKLCLTVIFLAFSVFFSLLYVSRETYSLIAHHLRVKIVSRETNETGFLLKIVSRETLVTDERVKEINNPRSRFKYKPTKISVIINKKKETKKTTEVVFRFLEYID